ncbi:MAG: hypothetical protein ABJN26_00060 [Stappiaceae bacterium]
MTVFKLAWHGLNNVLRGWRTLAANILFSIIPVLQLSEFRDVLPEQWLSWYALGVVLANMWLRKITTTPMGRKY